MERFPSYACANPPHSFYAYYAEASYHHSYRPFSPSSTPVPRRVPTIIDVPVFDSAASPSLLALPHSPSSAASIIQSHFRGYRVRRHHPLLHLRFIAKARMQLEELQSKLKRPDFPLNLRESENERLRLSESVMAIILRLDAIECPLAEVRSQRKDATKMAIKLQDALDGIVM